MLKTIGLFFSSHMNILKEYVKGTVLCLRKKLFRKNLTERRGEGRARGTLNPLLYEKTNRTFFVIWKNDSDM